MASIRVGTSMILGSLVASVGLVVFACSSTASNDTGAGAVGGSGGVSGGGERSVECEVPAGTCTGKTDCCFVGGGNPDSCVGPDEECTSELSNVVRFACDDGADCAPGSICCFDTPLTTCRVPAGCDALGGQRLCNPNANECQDAACTAPVMAGAPYLACTQ